MRPVPAGARLVGWDQVSQSRQDYGCIVAHNLTDLLDARTLCGPRILVLHETIEGAAREQSLEVSVNEFRSTVKHFLGLTGTHAVAVSPLKAKSWQLTDDIVPNSAEEHYPPWSGDLAKGLRVANHIARRPHT
ncbi:MAG: hypothetical protein ACRD3S_09010, partial [Terracidiphilus sp.]